MSQGPGWPAALAAGLVALAGLVEAATTDAVVGGRGPAALVALGTAAAVLLCRRAPGVALALVWVTCASQVAFGVPLLLVQLAIVVVAYGTARWGRTSVVVLSAVSIPLAGALGVLFAGVGIFRSALNTTRLVELLESSERFGYTWEVGAALAGTAVLGVPWLAGLTVRFSARASQSAASQVAAEQDAVRAQLESEQAYEIARLRDAQTQLARDVHDVVGHSLAVILAQAESAQYLPDDDGGQTLKKTLATIATSARASLQDVREVLSSTARPRPGGLDALVEGVRESGHEVLTSEVGQPQPLPPELEVVAFRVLQEMLTNAMRHGRRDAPVHVERHWPAGTPEADLRIEVRNVADPDLAGDAGGHGLDGMRRRLASVGGRLDVRRREEPVGPTFTATAWLPVRDSP